MDLCRRLIHPDPLKRFPSAGYVIEDPAGTFSFSRAMVMCDLAVCNFQEIRRWMADVQKAMVNSSKSRSN